MKKMQVWNLLDMNTRKQLVQMYNLKPSGTKEVIDNQLVRDGVQESDLELIPKKDLLSFLNYEENKTENPQSSDETPIQHSDSGGDSTTGHEEQPGISKRAGGKQNVT